MAEHQRCSGINLNSGISALPTQCQAVTSLARPEKGWKVEKFGAYCPQHVGLTKRGRGA